MQDSVYTRDRGVATANPQGDRGVGKPIEAAKALIPTIDLADWLCGPGQMRRIGDRWTARCPLPGHDEKTPSFTVYPGDRGWYCFGCQRGGDVVELASIAWGIGRADVAAAEVLMTFGHEIPERKPAWFRRQERQAPIRSRIERGRVEHVRLLVFRLIWMPWLRRLPEDIREEATADAWADSWWTADRLYSERRSA